MEITEYIRPELLSLIPMLVIVGRLLKATTFLNDRLIPLLLGVIGALVAVCYLIGEGVSVDMCGIVTAATQGILCAGAAVYGHQLVKQLRKQEYETEEWDE